MTLEHYERIIRHIPNDEDRDKIRNIIIGALNAKDVLGKAVPKEAMDTLLMDYNFFRSITNNARNLLTEAFE